MAVADDDLDALKSPSRIRWAPTDEEAADQADVRPLRRTASRQSIHSIPSRRASIDPSSALPITYRSVSYQIDENDDREKKRSAKDAVASELREVEWHTLALNDLYNRLSVAPSQGLSAAQVTRRLTEHGENVLSPPPTHYFQTIFGYLFKGFGSILLVGSILVFVAWKPLGDPPATANLALAIVLLAVFVIQAMFNAWQDWSSSRVMASIKHMLPDDCQVLRDGTKVVLTATKIVPGDLIYIKAGNKLPADVRFIEVSSDAKFDRSVLTGESVPLPGTVDSTDDNYLETSCIGLQGTHCVSGTATAIVVSTGDATIFGQIANLTAAPKSGLTPLEKEIRNFVYLICGIMVAMIIIVIIVWAAYLRKDHPGWINTALLIVDCVSIAIAFIPEGLPIAVTASLTIIANEMHKNRILCKSLKTVETLGSVSVICSDKTGTLTQNLMRVTNYSFGLQSLDVDSSSEKAPHETKGLTELRVLAGLCNAADFDASTTEQPLAERRIFGDATDQAVLRFSESIASVSDLRRAWTKTFEVAFNSKNKYMIATFVAAQSVEATTYSHGIDGRVTSGETMLTIKGAPDILLGRCATYVTADGEVAELDANARSRVEQLRDTWSSEGKRVILLAKKFLQRTSQDDSTILALSEDEVSRQATTDLILVGLVAMGDPPRPEIASVVATLRRAGIRVFMVTGDFALTAQAIAVECGIITSNAKVIDNVSSLRRDEDSCKALESAVTTIEDADYPSPPTSIVVSGGDLLQLNDHQWNQLCKYDEIVFARTTPQQKLRIVRAFQEREEVVGMTGDGVNDAPSLKAADIGIAIGSGSDIAMEAADMVLLDSFDAIVEAVRYGRVVFDNLKKTIAYLLPAGSFAEFWPVMTNVIFGLPQVLSSFLMIIICCFTDCAAAIALSYETPEADVLLRKPRRPGKDRLVDWKLVLQAYGFLGVLETVASFAMSYWYLERKGVPFSTMWFKYGEDLPPGLTQDYVNQRLNEASSIYFINLVVMQWFNLMAIRTRRLSLFQHRPIFDRATQNLYLFPAIAFSLVMAIFWLYVPGLQRALGTTSVPAEHFFLPVAFGLAIVFVDEARKWAVRKWPKGFLARIAW